MEELLDQMKVVTANIFSLYFKAHVFHWNVEDAHFPEYHAFFEKLYTEFWNSIDNYSEHIRAIEGLAPRTLGQLKELSQISEDSGIRTATEMIQILYDDNEILLASLEKAHDLAEQEKKYGLINFIEDRIDYHSKICWFLRATLNKL